MATIIFTVTESAYAYNAIPPIGIPGQPTTNQTLATPPIAAQAEELRQKIRDLFLAIDSNAEANTTVAVTFS